MDPNLRSLLDSPRVTPATRRVLNDRLEPPQRDPQVFTSGQFQHLTELIEELRPPYPRPTAHEIALEIDRRLAQNQGDGWRYEVLPPDREAYVLALEGKPSPEQARRFREDLLTEVTEIAYSHPEVQFAIGYLGFADAQGWRSEGREAWE